MSLSVVAAPGSPLIGRPLPDAEAWNEICLPSGDQLALLPPASGTAARCRGCSSRTGPRC